MFILEMPLHIKTDDAQTYIFIKMQQFYRNYGMKPIPNIGLSIAGQAIIKTPNKAVKEMLIA